jgi:hypothetical protein
LTPSPTRPFIAVPGASAAVHSNEEKDNAGDDDENEQDDPEMALMAVGNDSQHQHWTITDDPGPAGSRAIGGLGGSRTPSLAVS